MNETIDIKSRPGVNQVSPTKAVLIGTIEAISSQRGKYRLAITGTADNVDQLANVARMQNGIVRIEFSEESGE